MVIPHPQSAFKHIATAARTANRVVAVVQGESENSEDPAFKTELASSSQAITAGIALWGFWHICCGHGSNFVCRHDDGPLFFMMSCLLGMVGDELTLLDVSVHMGRRGREDLKDYMYFFILNANEV